MNISLHAHRRGRLLAIVAAASLLAVSLPVLHPVKASAATVQWVDGGDDIDCEQDDNGKALTYLSLDQQCQPIPTCHEVPRDPKVNPKYYGKIIQDSASNGIWQGAADAVLYEDDLPSDYYVSTSGSGSGSGSTPTKTPTTSPTKTPTTTTTPSGSASTGSKSGTGTGGSKSSGSKSGKTSTPSSSSSPSTASSTSTGSTTTSTDDLGIDPEETVTEGAPSAPGTPTLTVKGSNIVVKWQASADVDLDQVTGYTIQLSGDHHAEVDGSTFRYVFRDLPDGSYRAAVRAVNAQGPSAASTPSEPVVLGTPVTSVVGTLTWTGEVSPGSTVTLSGSGYAPGATLDLELHSDPVQLGTVTTDDQGAFTTDVEIPADAPEGDHALVVSSQGTIVSTTPVTLVAPEPAVADDAVSAATETAAAPETVPPLTGLVILVALAAAGVVLLLVHAARGGAGRGRPTVAGAAPAAETSQSAPTSSFTPLQLNKPVIPAFAPAGAGPVTTRTPTGVHSRPEGS